MHTITCQYCGQPAKLVKGSEVYAHPKFANLNVWECLPCNANVGTHKGTTIPLGTLANETLRTARIQAHKLFDKLWLGNKNRCRTTAYAMMARAMELPKIDCHIGHFNQDQCNKLIAFCITFKEPS